MIIIKIIILYFIQIRHTDDFPSTGTRLVSIIIAISWLFATCNRVNGELSQVICFHSYHEISNRQINDFH